MPAKQRYSGLYKVKKPGKYIGDPKAVRYLSSWEKTAFIWCEKNEKVKKWGSEVVIIDYICGTDKRMHKYHVDLFIEWDDGSKSLIEIKPERETQPPKGRKKTKKYITEALTYVKNTSKWRTAKAFAEKQGWKWEIWTEKRMRQLGIKIF